MEIKSQSRFNPYIIGQVTLLLGGVSLGLAILPQEIIKAQPTPLDISDVGVDDDASIQRRLKPYRITSMTVAVFGLCFGPIGWLRERPPLLPVTGMAMCVVALFWQWIVVGVLLAVVIVALFALPAS